MARIKWLNHPTSPEKNGMIEHVARQFAIVAVSYGQAEYIPYKNYVERLTEESAKPRTLQSGDVAAPYVEGTVWRISEHTLAGLVILRESGSEVTRFADSAIALQHGCPKELAKEFNQRITARMKQNEENAKIAQGNSWNSPVRFI